MLNMREIEAQAKALAPVFVRQLEIAKDSLRAEFKAQIADRDMRIEELGRALAERPSAEEIAKHAATLIPTPKDGENGKDADMVALKASLDSLVAELPAPVDGKSVTVDDVAPMIRDEVARAVAKIPAPDDGKSVSAEDVRPMIVELVGEAVKALPVAEPGKDADMEALCAHLKELFDAIPPAKDGQSVTVDDVLPALKEHADAYLKALPVPRDGESGKDAVAPTAEEIAATFERRFSDLVLSWERQARETFDKASDRMPIPKDGKNGRDALLLESFDMIIGEDGRTVTVKMQAGETVIERSLKLPTIIDRGVFSKDASYEQGDGTTYGGCYWIAQKDAPEGVPGGSADWRLAVKRGRDGKDLRDNASKHDSSKGVSIK